MCFADASGFEAARIQAILPESDTTWNAPIDEDNVHTAPEDAEDSLHKWRPQMEESSLTTHDARLELNVTTSTQSQ